MKSILQSVLKKLNAKTGIHSEIYDLVGVTVASTNGLVKNFSPQLNTAQYSKGIFVDLNSNTTHFLITADCATFVGIVLGVDEVSKNYAYLISSVMENAINQMDSNLSRNDNFKSILLAESSNDQSVKFLNKFKVQSKPCYALTIITQADKQNEVLALINQFASSDDEIVVMDDVTIAYIKFTFGNDEFDGHQSFGEVLHSAIINEINNNCLIGIGTSVSTPIDIHRSYEEAVSATRMSGIIGFKVGVYSYKEFILLKVLEELPRHKLRQYMDSLIDTSSSEILSDSAIMNTGEEFLNTSLNISETSKNLFMHRNTLVYRLDKIEKGMGLNIRKFSDAVTFRIITMIYKILKK